MFLSGSKEVFLHGGVGGASIPQSVACPQGPHKNRGQFLKIWIAFFKLVHSLYLLSELRISFSLP